MIILYYIRYTHKCNSYSFVLHAWLQFIYFTATLASSLVLHLHLLNHFKIKSEYETSMFHHACTGTHIKQFQSSSSSSSFTHLFAFSYCTDSAIQKLFPIRSLCINCIKFYNFHILWNSFGNFSLHVRCKIWFASNITNNIICDWFCMQKSCSNTRFSRFICASTFSS